MKIFERLFSWISRSRISSSVEVLRDEFAGNESWKKMVDLYRPDWERRVDKDLYLSTVGNEEIALVMAARAGSVEWFYQKIGALDGRSPEDVFKNEPAGAKIMKSLLMRMPD